MVYKHTCRQNPHTCKITLTDKSNAESALLVAGGIVNRDSPKASPAPASGLPHYSRPVDGGLK